MTTTKKPRRTKAMLGRCKLRRQFVRDIPLGDTYALPVALRYHAPAGDRAPA